MALSFAAQRDQNPFDHFDGLSKWGLLCEFFGSRDGPVDLLSAEFDSGISAPSADSIAAGIFLIQTKCPLYLAARPSLTLIEHHRKYQSC
jgi:hypothetical protein